MTGDETLDIDGAADVLKASPETVRELAPHLPGAAKIGRAWVFVKSDLINWIRDQSKLQRSQRMAPAPAAPTEIPRRKHGRRTPPELPKDLPYDQQQH